MINFHNITRAYGRKVAVDGLSLDVPPGELFAFLGPNGAGKTTTIKMLVGLLQPDAGNVKVCGYDVAAEPRMAARCIGYVPDEPFLYDKLSGREFLEFAAEMRGLERAAIPQRLARESARFELTDFLDQLIETYSHGMRQRLVFASALLHDPAVVVIDEPTVGLDPRSVRLVKDLLRVLATAGATVFMSTHILTLAEEIADRIGIVHRGRLHFVGTMSDLRQELSAKNASLERFFLDLTDGTNGRGSPAAPPCGLPGPVMPST
jgi:ABC-2 type transport system ATP-binding protein